MKDFVIPVKWVNREELENRYPPKVAHAWPQVEYTIEPKVGEIDEETKRLIQKAIGKMQKITEENALRMILGGGQYAVRRWFEDGEMKEEVVDLTKEKSFTFPSQYHRL